MSTDPSPYLDPALRSWRDQVRELVQSELVPLSAQIEREGRIPERSLALLRSAGLFGTHTPAEWGGLGLSMLGSCLAIEELAAAHIAFYYTCGVNVHIGSKAVEHAGSEELKRRFLPPLARGEMIASLAMTEPGAGSDAAGIATSARREADRYVLNGRKIFITNAQIAGCFTVIARTDADDRRGGLSAFVVERDRPGLAVGPAMDMLAGSGSFHNELLFEDCAIPLGNRIGREGQGFELALLCLDHGRTHWAAWCSGLASEMLALAQARVASRRQFGAALAENQAVQWKLADLATEVHRGRLVAHDAAWRFDHDPARRRHWAAMAKLANADMVFRVADDVLQLFGGYGYCRDHPIERMWRESRVVRILDGTSEMMRQVVGREAVRPPRDAGAA
ncbi:MAG: acyl-CoA dehydrogenase family protein [Pseudomonadota bacterium]|nr:acyl-CoA dehydrogenase family protein [Pseudomonadota bacterium]